MEFGTSDDLGSEDGKDGTEHAPTATIGYRRNYIISYSMRLYVKCASVCGGLKYFMLMKYLSRAAR